MERDKSLIRSTTASQVLCGADISETVTCHSASLHCKKSQEKGVILPSTNSQSLSNSHPTIPQVFSSNGPQQANKMTVTESMGVVVTGKRAMKLEKRPVTDPGPEEVLVEIEFCGICGTDLHLWLHNGVGFWTLKTPCGLGHEASGRVLKAGAEVKHLVPGDRVTMEPADYCGRCVHCTAGNNNLCHLNTVEDLAPLGFFANHVTYPAFLCHRLPDSITMEEGSLVEPLACALRGVLRANIRPGEDILILGAGPIGVLSALACKSYGAHRIVITDINQGRLDLAMESKAVDGQYLVQRGKDQATQVQEITDLMGRSPDVTLDCTGMESCLRLAIDVTRRGGRVGMVGLAGGNVSVPLTIASMKEIDLIATAKYDTSDFRLAIKMLENKSIDAAKVVSHIIRLEDFQEAFEMVEKGKGSKILIKCS